MREESSSPRSQLGTTAVPVDRRDAIFFAVAWLHHQMRTESIVSDGISFLNAGQLFKRLVVLSQR